MRVFVRRILAVAVAVVGLAGFAVAGCAHQDPRVEAVARRAIDEAWNRGVFDGAPMLAPKVLLHVGGKDIPLTPDDAFAVVKHWRAAFPDFHFRIEDAIVQGDKVALRVPFTGTQQGKFWGVEPTGRKIAVTETLIVRVEHGLIVEMWEDFDEYAMRQQLGLLDDRH